MPELRSDLSLLKTSVVVGVKDIVQNRMDVIVRHCQKDENVIPEKPCELTLKIKVTPNKNKDVFAVEISDALKLSPRNGFETIVGAEVDEDGNVVYQELAPRLPL